MTSGQQERVDCVVVGAGIVGLAVTRALARAGRSVLVVDGAAAVGTGISSRNSEVLHAGMYYPPGSLRARLCVRGNQMLRDFAAASGVQVTMCGKLIVATTDEDRSKLEAIADRGRANGVEGLALMTAAAATALEPNLRCRAALFSPQTGIVDSHALMQALQADAEAHGALVALRAPVVGGGAGDGHVRLDIGGDSPMVLLARQVVVAAGVGACALARALGAANVPTPYLCKGNYFALTGKTPFSRLVYPVPEAAGLGVHFTLDLGGRGRFGPDVEWVADEDYTVDPRRADRFYHAIRQYWPGLADGALAPAYCGIRPKIHGPPEPAADFVIHGPGQTGVDGLIALYGIESPGLTSSLALAELVGALAA